MRFCRSCRLTCGVSSPSTPSPQPRHAAAVEQAQPGRVLFVEVERGAGLAVVAVEAQAEVPAGKAASTARGRSLRSNSSSRGCSPRSRVIRRRGWPDGALRVKRVSAPGPAVQAPRSTPLASLSSKVSASTRVAGGARPTSRPASPASSTAPSASQRRPLARSSRSTRPSRLLGSAFWTSSRPPGRV